MIFIKTIGGHYWEQMRHNSDGTTNVIPIGGGYITTLDDDKIAERDVELPNEYDYIDVGFDGDRFCTAFVHRHERWNGFLLPFVPLAQLDDLITAQQIYIAGFDGDEGDLLFKRDGDALLWISEGDVDRIEATTLVVAPDCRVAGFHLGGSLCWVRV